MHRRALIAGLAMAGLMPRIPGTLSDRAEAADDPVRPFDDTTVRQMARDLATRPYAAPDERLILLLAGNPDQVGREDGERRARSKDDLLDLPDWVQQLSPLSHPAQLPVEDFAATPLVWLGGLTVLGVGLGLVGLSRRQIYVR